jgi:hypothetical protein
MADDAFERVLRLVSEGHLSAEEAEPILDAMAGRASQGTGAGAGADPGAEARSADARPAEALRIEVTEAGRTVVNLRVPLSLGRAAITRVPGISDLTSERIREAIAAGIKGAILEVDDEGGTVKVSIE